MAYAATGAARALGITSARVRDDVRWTAVPVGLGLLAVLIPNLAVKLVALTVIAAGLIIAVLVP